MRQEEEKEGSGRVSGLTRKQMLLRGGAVIGGLAVAPIVAACTGEKAAAPPATTAEPVTTAESEPATTAEPEPATTAAPTEAVFDELHLGTVAPGIGLDPQVETASWFGALSHMYSGLLYRYPDRTLLPDIAAALPERLDDLTWRATLAERTFTDGSPITAEDVKFSYDRILGKINKDFASPFKDYLANLIDEVTIVDPTTIEFKMLIPSDLLPDRMPMAKIVPKAVVEAKGDKGFANSPDVGSGSVYNIQPFSPDKVAFAAYEGYDSSTVPAVHAAKMDYSYIAEAQARIAQAEAGQLHIIDGISPQLYDAVSGSSAIDLGLTPVDQTSFVEVVMFNCGKKPWADRRVRQAFM